MTTLTHPQGIRMAPAQARPRRMPQTHVRAGSSAPSDGWLDRLAAWADRQPVHRRLGHWGMLR